MRAPTTGTFRGARGKCTPEAVVDRYFCSMSPFVRLLTLTLLALAVLLAPVAVRPTQGQAVQGAPTELLYLALGDSVPSGADLPDSDGYPSRLGQALANAGNRPIRLINRAQAGDRSAGVLANQIGDVSAIQPELVTLTVGANDLLIPAIECASGSVDQNPDTRCSGTSLMRAVPTFERNLRAILHRLVTETGATVVVTTYFNPFPRGSRCAPGATDLALRVLNSTISDVAAEFGDRGVVVDLAPLFKGHEGREPTGWFSPNPARIACTDVHPNADGHDAIARAIWSALSPRLALTTP
jgi:lysophospholipase L1-like esterase